MTSDEKAEQMKYKQVVVTRHGSPEVLQVVEKPLPEPRAGEVRVEVLAAGVSAFDLIYRRWGRLPGSPPCHLLWVRISLAKWTSWAKGCQI